jgi:hypothetical protein
MGDYIKRDNFSLWDGIPVGNEKYKEIHTKTEEELIDDYLKLCDKELDEIIELCDNALNNE